jgi:alpha-N-arabinofuranosidase
MNAFNTFEKPEVVKPVQFKGFKMKDGILAVTMPAKSVVVLELVK